MSNLLIEIQNWAKSYNQKGGVQGSALTFSCENTKITTSC